MMVNLMSSEIKKCSLGQKLYLVKYLHYVTEMSSEVAWSWPLLTTGGTICL